MQQPQRETMTDSLASIVQVLQLGYKSGTLVVERGTDEEKEEGCLVLSNGRVVDASAGSSRGIAAFNYLKTWGVCRFSFIRGVFLSPVSENGTRTVPMPRPLNGGSTAPLLPAIHLKEGMKSSFPGRSPSGDAVLSSPEVAAQLPRNYRRLLLLTNGQRSPYELARLVGRDLKELQVWLDELERAGLIHQ